MPDALLAAGLLQAALFAYAERRQQAPMLPLGLFSSRDLSGATGAGYLLAIGLTLTLRGGNQGKHAAEDG